VEKAMPFRARRAFARLLALVLWCSLAATAAAAEPFKPFKLKTPDGKEQALADVLGSRATLVFFFFPTCVYCNQAFPHVQKLYDAYKDKGLSIVWINAVPSEQKLIADWRARHGYTVPVLVGASVRMVERDYAIKLTPTHYLLDASGNIVARHDGYQPGDETAIEEQIVKALQ
jgi:thiol-disulfide isomerase/thioredoxin